MSLVELSFYEKLANGEPFLLKTKLCLSQICRKLKVNFPQISFMIKREASVQTNESSELTVEA